MGVDTVYQEAVLDLWRAVLMAALDDLSKLAGDHPESPWRWLASKDDGVGSFEFVCEALELSPQRLRKHLAGLLAQRRYEAKAGGAKKSLRAGKI